jgi:glycosyltransferase involved in cell wall biosynthesis
LQCRMTIGQFRPGGQGTPAQPVEGHTLEHLPGTVDTSVIIPSYNRPEQLAACLEAVVAQEDDAPFEVVVVDDGSRVPLADVCARFGDRVRCVRQENAGPAAARNRAVREARGAFLAFTDDDCRPRPGWLHALRRAHDGVVHRIVGGVIENGRPRDPFATASQDLADYLYDYYGAAEGTAPFFTTNNMGCMRAAFLDLGGFDEGFGRNGAEDRDFGMRWREAGRALILCPEAIIDHHHEMTLREFFRQHANYGRGAFHLHGVMRARGSPLPKVEPLSFYLNLVVWPVRKAGLRRVPSMVLMGLTQVAMVAGYAQARSRARRAVRDA